ncbi:hypothetical protein [Clostridium sporogenes]|uniref:hypothetical protein n=1 Tax=Clostridium sporogenes TaxID=1509 RepID=UPI00066676CC|nr:hypothetical protein [Clostridium sporogenes]NFT38907.1 hypothetical protein [Clostridium sporogenes]NFT53640.1 hypothetical protein [Clostridium sporogenes]NFT74056.1 hypothetical protein [Clostridium sporogenes]
MDIHAQRFYKKDKIVELYRKRNTQQFVADQYGMTTEDVGKVLRLCNFSHTREKNGENLKEGELRKVVLRSEELAFLDKYDLQNFDK